MRFCGLRSASSSGSQAEVTRRSQPSLPAPRTAWAMETQVLTPHVYWAQRHRELYLRVELSDVQVEAGLRAARGIGVPVGRPAPMRSCSAPAGAANGGAPVSPRAPVRSGVLRVVPGVPFVPGRRPGEPQRSPGGRPWLA